MKIDTFLAAAKSKINLPNFFIDFLKNDLKSFKSHVLGNVPVSVRRQSISGHLPHPLQGQKKFKKIKKNREQDNA